MPKTTTRLSEIAPVGGEFTPMDQIADQDLLLLGYDARTTQFGQGYMLTLSDLEGGDPFSCLTSAVVVCEQIGKLIEAGTRLPVIVKFTKPGKAWLIV